MVVKKLAGVAIALLVLFQVANGIGFFSQSDAQAIDQIPGMNIIDSVKLMDSTNKGITSDELLDQGSEVKLEYTWSLPDGHGYQAGDTFTFHIPDEFLLFNDITDAALKLDDGTTVGTFTATAATHNVVMTFNENIDNNVVAGILEFKSQFDKQKITGSTTHVISIPIKETTQELTLHFKPYITSAIDKSGVPNGFNPNRIDWTVDVNKALDKVTNAVMSDVLPTGLSMADTSSVQVYQLNVNVDGSVALGAALDPALYTADLTNGALNVHFVDNHDQFPTAYRITFSTTIDDASKGSFTNKAVFQGDNKTAVDASSTVNVNYGKLLDKSSTGYDSSKQEISWTIKYNYRQQTIAQTDAKLVDTFNDEQELVPGSIIVFPIKLNLAGEETQEAALPAADYTVVSTSNGVAHLNGFDLQFNNPITSAYKVEYKTRSINRVDGASVTKIKNTVSTNGTSASADRDIHQVILQKFIDKIDYTNQTVTWKIRLNEDSKTMTNALLKDEFTGVGLKLDRSSLSVKPDSGPTATYTDSYTESAPPAANDGFVIRFNEAIDVPYTILYTTRYSNDWLAANWLTINASYPNYTTVQWDENAGAPAEATKTFDPNQETIDNGYKSGSYNATTKEIQWTIGVNYNRKALTKAIVQDQLLSGQKLVTGSLQVYNMTIAANGEPGKGQALDSADYTLTYEDGMIKVDLGAISTGYVVVFRTSLANELIDASVSNTAQLLDDTTRQSRDLKATVNIPKGGEYINKSGQQSGGKINWTLNINRGQSTIKDALVTDNPTGNQLLIPDSFHLYPTNVASNGDITKKNPELVKDTDYKLTIETDDETGLQSFKLAFLHEINSAYVLEYQSLIVANNGDTVSNKASFSGNNVRSVTKDFTKDIIVGVSSGSGTGSGVRVSLIVLKQDENDQTPLAGATFSLFRKSGGDRILVNTLTTGDDGKIEFKKLLQGSYVLVETVAPYEYQLDPTEHDVEIASTTAVSLTLNNKRILGSLSLLKQDDTDHTSLAGATFDLYRKSGASRVLVDTLTTDDNGKLEFTKLIFGDYVLVEKTAPYGYELDATEHTFKIDSAAAVTLTLQNTKILCSLSVLKQDEIDQTPLAGATFELYRKSGASRVLVDTLTTDDNGKLEFTGLIFGDYVLVETAAPYGYQLDATEHAVTIDNATVALKLNNKRILGSLSLLKQDATDQTPLKGATFELYRKSGASRVLVDTLTTDDNGKLEFTKLIFGDYVLVEKTAPYGYELDATEHTFKIESAAAVALTLKNTKILCSLSVLKQDELDHTPLAGATFELYRDSGASRELVDTQTTNDNGKLEFTNLIFGDYVLVETAAPYGYQLDATEHAVTIDNATVALTLNNKRILGSLSLLKQDDIYHAPLKGATFELYRKSGASRVLVDKLTTDDKGKLEFTKLIFGDYVLVEKTAPYGYELDATEHTFKIESAAAVALTLENTRSPVYMPPFIPEPPKPTDPTTTPTDPTKPTTPTTPSKPTTPTTPTTPSKPTTPTTPSKPTTPSEPEKKPDIHKSTGKDEVIESSLDVPLGGIAVVNQGPKHGQVTVKPDGSWTYKPSKGYTGKDGLSIIVKDKDGNAEETFIDITVGDVPLGTLDPDAGATLPKTGESSHMDVKLAGLAVILLGLALLLKRPFRRSK